MREGRREANASHEEVLAGCGSPVLASISEQVGSIVGQ